MVASRHSAGTSASRQQETIQPPQQLPHSTTQHQCPPRTDADAHDATPADDPETASADAMHDQLVDSSSYPSQLLTLKVLRRPVESALGPVIGVVDQIVHVAVESVPDRL